MEYLSIKECADNWNISKRRIQILCKEGRIVGAKMLGNMWLIPENANRPADARFKISMPKYIYALSPARKELKVLLKKLYSSCEAQCIPLANQRDYVLSVISSELCSFYMEKNSAPDLFNMLYQQISSCKYILQPSRADLSKVAEYICRYHDDDELDDILSWAYQYSNKFISGNEFSKTQFFTEKYMIRYLVQNTSLSTDAKKILDPCVGGGNFLTECLDQICNKYDNISKDVVTGICSMLYGYDIDMKIANIAAINIRLRAISILRRNNIPFDISVWDEIRPNIYISPEDTIQGALAKNRTYLRNIITKETVSADVLFNNADIVLTNPPFASVKGMKQELKDFLRKYYPLSNCDTCAAFIEAAGKMINKNGVCGIVCQNAWMHLKSFDEIRRLMINNYRLEKILNLGSGSFQDLSGEKSNVALIIFSANNKKNNIIDIADISSEKYEDKVNSVMSNIKYIHRMQDDLCGVNGFNLYENKLYENIQKQSEKYQDIATPMQGTSTGNAKELVGFFWEHFGDNDWVIVSNGGGYCRWQGLNHSVVKWGKTGEYIKAQKGSALRNAKYFQDTQMVFSDTGTAGLNVRVLLDGQIFIASGPGIRIKKGNEYSHMAFLNSRLASYYLRLMSPKLTIAAGYIGQLPVNAEICSSVVLEKNAHLCTELKNKMLSIRTSNIEYSDKYLSSLPSDINKAAWVLFNEDITNELMKLEIEQKIDSYLMENFMLSADARQILDDSVGKCAYVLRTADTHSLESSKLDNYIYKLLDCNCCLKRTKNKKDAIGSDGYIEYASKDLNLSPVSIVEKIQESPFVFDKVINKYKYLLLHNYVLHYMGYDTKSGVSVNNVKVEDIANDFSKHFNYNNYDEWIMNDFNAIHSDIFKNVPYLIYQNGKVHTV